MTVQQRALEYVFHCGLCVYRSQKCQLSDVLFIRVLDLMFPSFLYTFLWHAPPRYLSQYSYFGLFVVLFLIFSCEVYEVTQFQTEKRRERKKPKQSFLSPRFSNSKVPCVLFQSLFLMTFQFKTQKRLSKYLTRNLIRLLPEPKHCHSFSCHLTALKTPSTKCNHSDTLLHTNSLHSLLFSSPYDRYSCTLTSEQHTA